MHLCVYIYIYTYTHVYGCIGRIAIEMAIPLGPTQTVGGWG